MAEGSSPSGGIREKVMDKIIDKTDFNEFKCFVCWRNLHYEDGHMICNCGYKEAISNSDDLKNLLDILNEFTNK